MTWFLRPDGPRLFMPNVFVRERHRHFLIHI
jgi:hypothetical protein